MENKKEIVARLKLLLMATRAGSDIEEMELSEDESSVSIVFRNGGIRNINVECDSGIALIRDVCQTL